MPKWLLLTKYKTYLGHREPERSMTSCDTSILDCQCHPGFNSDCFFRFWKSHIKHTWPLETQNQKHRQNIHQHNTQNHDEINSLRSYRCHHLSVYQRGRPRLCHWHHAPHRQPCRSLSSATAGIGSHHLDISLDCRHGRWWSTGSRLCTCNSNGTISTQDWLWQRRINPRLPIRNVGLGLSAIAGPHGQLCPVNNNNTLLLFGSLIRRRTNRSIERALFIKRCFSVARDLASPYRTFKQHQHRC